MVNKIVKAALCLCAIAAIFAGTGCTGRAADREGDAAKATPTAAPSSTPQPALSPAGPGNYTTNLSLDDIYFSGGDEQEGYVEDLLPTPPAE